MSKSERALVENLYPIVEATLQDKNKSKQLEKIISDYMGRNGEKLSSFGPTEQILLPKSEQQAIFKIFNLTEKQILDAKKQSSVIFDGQTMGYPFLLLMPLVARYYAINKDDAMTNVIVMYIAMFIYPLLFTKYFKHPPVKNVMAFTINNMQNKFKIKQTGSLQVTILETAQGAYNLHSKGIIVGNDWDIMQFVLAVRTRLNSMLKKIANEYYENHQQGNYLNLEMDIDDDDNYLEADATIYHVSNIVNKVANDLVISGPNYKIVQLAAKTNNVSVNSTRAYMDAILQKTNLDNISIVLESILNLYLESPSNRVDEINSNKFLIQSLDMYKRSNTNNKSINNIKTILNEWMESTDSVKKTSNVSTLNNFRKAIYTYFVMSIQMGNLR